MNIVDHVEACKTLIEQIPSQPKVKLFSGTLTADKIKDLNLDGQTCYVLLGCIGGPVPLKKDRMGLECDAVLGAFVIAKSDNDTKGLSRQAMRTANDIALAIDNFRGNIKTNPKLPELQLIEEMFSGMEGRTNFAAWQVVWTQRITLS